MTAPRFTFGDPHYPGLVPVPVDGCDCSRCEYLREFEADWEEDALTECAPDPLPHLEPGRKAA